MKREEGNSLQTCSLEMIKIQHSGGGAGWRIELQTNLCKDLIFIMEKAPTTICRHDTDTKVGQSSVKVLVGEGCNRGLLRACETSIFAKVRLQLSGGGGGCKVWWGPICFMLAWPCAPLFGGKSTSVNIILVWLGHQIYNSFQKCLFSFHFDVFVDRLGLKANINML